MSFTSDGLRRHYGQCHATPMSLSLILNHFILYHFEHIIHLIMLFVFETLLFVVQNFTLLFFLSFLDFLSQLTDASVPSVAGASDCCVHSALSVASGCDQVPLCADDMAVGALARIESLPAATAPELLSQSTYDCLSLTHTSPSRMRCSHILSSIWLIQCLMG